MASVTTREELPDLPFRHYHPIPKIVTAVQLSEAEDIPNPFATDSTFHGEPGDWKITYGTNSDGSFNVAICEQSIFNQTYEHIENDKYRKKTSTVIEAAQLRKPLDIITLEGPSRGESGDWLLIGVGGEPYFNDDVYFKSRYIRVD